MAHENLAPATDPDDPIVDFKGVAINHGKCRVYFCRHAQSLANVNQWPGLDTPLSELGIEQAKKVVGHFDLILCSPLRRTLETLHYSQITYDKLSINHNLREMIQDMSSVMILEQRPSKGEFVPESNTSFWRRAAAFHQELEKACQDYDKILIIGHGFFFNGWYRRGCFPTPANAQIIRLV